MSIHATVLAWQAEVAPVYKLILLALAEDGIGDSGDELVPIELHSLAARTGYNDQDALEHLREMCAMGVIEMLPYGDRLWIRDRYEIYHVQLRGRA